MDGSWQIDGDHPDLRWRYDWAEIEKMDGHGTVASVLSAGQQLGIAGTFIGPDDKVDVDPFDSISVAIRFTDANGLRWSCRDTQAPVRRIDAE